MNGQLNPFLFHHNIVLWEGSSKTLFIHSNNSQECCSIKPCFSSVSLQKPTDSDDDDDDDDNTAAADENDSAKMMVTMLMAMTMIEIMMTVMMVSMMSI